MHMFHRVCVVCESFVALFAAVSSSAARVLCVQRTLFLSLSPVYRPCPPCGSSVRFDAHAHSLSSSATTASARSFIVIKENAVELNIMINVRIFKRTVVVS